jgi:cyanophycinase
MRDDAPPHSPGTLMMIGGNEDKSGNRTILTAFARLVGGGRLVVATLASEEPEYQWETYSTLFRHFGINDIVHLAAQTRDEFAGGAHMACMDGAAAVFFTGGDQLKITNKLGGTAIYERIRSLYKHEGGVVAGTSAGAAAMGQVMLMSPNVEGTEKHKIGRAFLMARGLGFTRDMVIDQHFAQRARIERLLGAMAENPGVLGVGIDEDTAIVVKGAVFDVIGSGAVYVSDGSQVTYTNATQGDPNNTLCLFDVRLHVLSHGSSFDMSKRRPFQARNQEVPSRPEGGTQCE